MSDLQFTKIGDQDLYAAEVVVNGNFNIRLERVGSSGVRIYQKTGSETEEMDEQTAEERGFDNVFIPGNIHFYSGKIFDYDFDGLVYPKVIRIESKSEVLSGTVTESGYEA